MERKNTMLLTVIAVATLLVAVVGATFAYFTASGGSSATSTVQVTTESVSNSTITGDGHATLIVSAAEMDFASDNKGGDVITAEGSDSTTDSAAEISYLHENNATSDTVCTYSLMYTPTQEFTYSPTNTAATKAAELVLLVTPSVVGGTIAGTNNTAGTTYELDLGTITGTTETTVLSDVTMTIPAGEDATVTYTVEYGLYNTDFDQSDLAGVPFDGTVELVQDSCVVGNN